MTNTTKRQAGLYDPAYEHDACGVGFCANINGQRSHRIIEHGVRVLENLLHRGATGADANTGDGAGLLFAIPDGFFRRVARTRVPLPDGGRYGVGMLFLPTEPGLLADCVATIESTAAAEGMDLLGWREVPCQPEVLGEQARRKMPVIRQCFVTDRHGIAGDALERRLYILRKQIEKAVRPLLAADPASFYICSLSARTIVYKGLMMATQVPAFYTDLGDDRLESAFVVVHQRYSTNTFPSWPLAHPFRYLAHNGEINTLRGNLNAMRSREQSLASPLFGADIGKLVPVIEEGVSDSACLDNALELLVQGGRSLEHAMMMLIPQAWGARYPMGPDLRGFFEYHAGIMEPWDGPAAVVMTDGRRLGAMLDRNGLRPARYTLTDDGFIVFASEAGVLPDIPAASVRQRGALRPGRMILIDLEHGTFEKDDEIKMRLAHQQPYRRWVKENRIDVHGFFDATSPLDPDHASLPRRQKRFGYTREDIDVILAPMACSGAEPTGSMGSDQPLAVLSEKPQLLYWYFKQMFAQITNPAIDPIREELVMSLMTFMGTTANILSEVPGHARLVKLQHPILSHDDLTRIRTLKHEDFRCHELDMSFPAGGNGRDLEQALAALCAEGEAAVRAKCRFLVLSDRRTADDRTPIPALLAVSALHQHLIRCGLRTSISIILETGEAREVMHIALLLGYGASAINPYLAFETIADLAARGELEPHLGVPKAMENYTKGLCKGLLKVMSKMGISTLRSYRSAQIFEAVGLKREVVDRYFPGTASRVEGIGLDAIAREADRRRADAAADADAQESAGLLPAGGQYKYRVDGERHMWTPETISLLQQATRRNDPELFRQFAGLINNQQRHQFTLRGLLRFRPETTPVPLAEVEPASAIVKRFVTGAMSFGSISREAHETLAIAMNRLGGKSNSGEGGEDPDRYRPLPGGDSRCSAIKQVASGRFGVTAAYLASARELQIKIAQGAKPGEGGQLPGHKVNKEIARVRHSTPGVTLVSPPPHHDIYSIEDIAQLIYDLKCANPDARISVKLVAEMGVGTIAAGVAKGHADMILISGYDGGTGASPVSSIKHAGVPWELGLAETQQTLVLNDLRSRVRLQTDGQLRTGRDVVIAALLGAEEFGFATSALVVCGCVMMRKCHKNTCPVGVATQDPELRKRYAGKPEHVINFMNFIAEDARAIMAQLGCRRFDELIGRTDLLEFNDAIDFWKARGLDYSNLLHQVPAPDAARRCTMAQDHGLDRSLDHAILARIGTAIEDAKPVTVALPIRNVHRTVGTMIAHRIAVRHGHTGLPKDTLTLHFTGAAGQSFAAFGARGMTFILEGEANDYMAKGLSGAKVIVKPYPGSGCDPAANIIAGNVLLYGATAGHVYINGQAGERFAIRNSGAVAVVEGVGDHGCEYMTGGRVVVLGSTGVNFAAGMSGGIAYVYDEQRTFENLCNLDTVDLELVTAPADQKELRILLEKHVQYTGSPKAAAILKDWDLALRRFIKVFPMEYRKALGQIMKEDAETEREAVVEE